MMSIRLLFVMLAIVMVAMLLAWAGSAGGAYWQSWPVYALCVALAFVVQWLMFIPAWFWQTERYYDLTGSLTYLSVVVMALTLSQTTDSRALVLAVLVALWAVRLGSFLFVRIMQDGSDGRFDRIKPHFLRFLMTWTLQGLWVSFTAASALAVMSSQHSVALGGWFYVGLALWLLGFGVEVVADRQKRRFRTSAESHKGFIQSGLWAYSRHPNYLGEILLWLGVSVIAFPVLQGWQLATLISPVFVFLLLTRVSGIPLLEARSDKRWGEDQDYQAYKARTPVLVPFVRFWRDS